VGGFEFLSQKRGRWTRAGKWRVHAIFQGLNDLAPSSGHGSWILRNLPFGAGDFPMAARLECAGGVINVASPMRLISV
jgi:hypothetical protein